VKHQLVDLNYEICSEKWNLLGKLKSRFSMPYVIEGFIRAIFFTCKSVVDFNLNSGKGDVLFLVGSHNQFKTLCAIKFDGDDLLTVSFLGYHNYFSKTLDGRVPTLLFYALGWLTLPITLYSFLSIKNKFHRRALLCRLDRLIVSGVAVKVWRFLFKRWRTKVLVVSNDHNHWCRSAIKAANSLSIKTCYVAHAMTNSDFPDLDVDLAFLDSNYQKSLYGIVDKNKTLVKVVGAVRYEQVIAMASGTALTGVMVCFNQLDSLRFMKELAIQLQCLASQGVKIYIKAHPADYGRYKEIELLCHEFGYVFVAPKSNIWDYRNEVQVLLGGVTGAHVDALMCNMIPCTLATWYKGDYYGLQKEGSILVLAHLSELAQNIESRAQQILTTRVRYNYHLNNLSKKPSSIIKETICKLVNNDT
jgi:hypothetical protein